jgi:hypothetical protein
MTKSLSTDEGLRHPISSARPVNHIHQQDYLFTGF